MNNEKNVGKIADILIEDLLKQESNNGEFHERLNNLIVSAVKYTVENNHTKTNYIAQDLFENSFDNELISKLFDEFE